MVLNTKCAYRENKNALQLNIGTMGRYPGVFFNSRTVNDEWEGAGPADFPKGKHVYTGVRRKDGLYVYIDGEQATYMPHKNGVIVLDNPEKMIFKCEKAGKIHKVEIGTGWPPQVKMPPTFADLFGEVAE